MTKNKCLILRHDLGIKKSLYFMWILQSSRGITCFWKAKTPNWGLERFRDENFFFSGGTHGWNPADIFCSLREKGNVHGKIIEIVWVEKNKIKTREI